MAHARRTAVALLAVSTFGCGSGLSHVQGGYAHAIAKSPEEAGVAVDAHATLIQGPVAALGGPFGLLFGSGTSGFESREHFGIGGIARGKLGANVRQIALAPTLYLADGGERHSAVGFYALSAYHLVQLEWLGPDARFAFGMLSPLVQGGIVIRPIWTTLSIAGEYDVRFSSAPNTGYVTFLIGVGRLKYD